MKLLSLAEWLLFWPLALLVLVTLFPVTLYVLWDVRSFKVQ